jgi:hypothetical protein
MSRFHSTWAAIVLVGAALALGACGGDDNNDSTTSPAATGTDTTATTGTTEDKTTGKTTEDKPTKTRTRERGDDSGGGGSNRGSGGGSNTSGNDGTTQQKSSSKKGSEQLTPANTFSTAKTVCGSFLPKALERQLKSGKKSADEIARDYSKGYPAEQRKKAYSGCKAGLAKKD